MILEKIKFIQWSAQFQNLKILILNLKIMKNCLHKILKKL